MADRRSNGIEYRVNLAADEIGQRRPENITQIDRAGRRQRERAMPAEDIEYDGGLMSYGENVSLLSSAYDARIVTAKAADLPVVQPTKFELFIELQGRLLPTR
jgi:hypothetical protein